MLPFPGRMNAEKIWWFWNSGCAPREVGSRWSKYGWLVAWNKLIHICRISEMKSIHSWQTFPGLQKGLWSQLRKILVINLGCGSKLHWANPFELDFPVKTIHFGLLPHLKSLGQICGAKVKRVRRRICRRIPVTWFTYQLTMKTWRLTGSLICFFWGGDMDNNGIVEYSWPIPSNVATGHSLQIEDFCWEYVNGGFSIATFDYQRANQIMLVDQ